MQRAKLFGALFAYDMEDDTFKHILQDKQTQSRAEGNNTNGRYQLRKEYVLRSPCLDKVPFYSYL